LILTDSLYIPISVKYIGMANVKNQNLLFLVTLRMRLYICLIYMS